QAIISAVTHDTSEAKVTIENVPDRPGIAAKMFRALADEAVNVDMIVQNVSVHGHTDISFTVPRDDLARALKVMETIVAETEATGFRHDTAVGRVSLIGAGMKSNPGVAAKMFEVLAGENVNIEMISTSTSNVRSARCTARSAWRTPREQGDRDERRRGGRDGTGGRRDAARPRGARVPGPRA